MPFYATDAHVAEQPPIQNDPFGGEMPADTQPDDESPEALVRGFADLLQSPEYTAAEPDVQASHLNRLKDVANEYLPQYAQKLHPQQYDALRGITGKLLTAAWQDLHARKQAATAAAPKPEGTMKTIGRILTTKSLPAATTAGGAALGVMATAPTMNPLIMTAADIAGGTAGKAAGEAAMKGIMGEDAYHENEAQIEANRIENPIATAIAETPIMLAEMAGGPGRVVKDAAGNMVAKTLTKSAFKKATDAVAKNTAFRPGAVERVLHTGQKGLRLGIADSTAAKYVGGHDDVSIIEGGLRSAIAMGATGLIPWKTPKTVQGMVPVAKQIIVQSGMRGTVDALVMRLAGALVDVAKGEPMDWTKVYQEGVGSIPAFVVQNALTMGMGRAAALHRSARAAAESATEPTRVAAAQARKDGFELLAAEMEKKAELDKEMMEAQEIARLQAEADAKLAEEAAPAKATVEHTQSNEGPITATGAYGRGTDVYDVTTGLPRKAPAEPAPTPARPIVPASEGTQMPGFMRKPVAAPERIVSATVTFNGKTYEAPTHPQAAINAAYELAPKDDRYLSPEEWAQAYVGAHPDEFNDGFKTSFGRIVSREEAHDISKRSKQWTGAEKKRSITEKEIDKSKAGGWASAGDIDMRVPVAVPVAEPVTTQLAEIVPAIKVNGTLIRGLRGDSHQDILNRLKDSNPEQYVEALPQFDSRSNPNLFVDGNGNEISRAELKAMHGVSDAQGLRDAQKAAELVERIREDLPEAQPILSEIESLITTARERHAAMAEGQTKSLTNELDMLTEGEKNRLSELKSMIRPKSQAEAKADVAKKRAERISPAQPAAAPAAEQPAPAGPQSPSVAASVPKGFTKYASSPTLDGIKKHIAKFYGGEQKDVTPNGDGSYTVSSQVTGKPIGSVVIETKRGFFFGTVPVAEAAAPQVAQPTKIGGSADVQIPTRSGAPLTVSGQSYVFPGFEDIKIVVVKPSGSKANSNKAGWRVYEQGTGMMIAESLDSPNHPTSEQDAVSLALQTMRANGKVRFVEKLDRFSKAVEDARKPIEVGDKYSVYPRESIEGQRWLVQSTEGKRGFGDSIHVTKEEAEKYAATEKTRDAERAISLKRQEESKSAEAAAKTERERSVTDYTSSIGATPLAAGKLKKTLMEPVARRTGGVVYEGTRAQVAGQLLAIGFKPTTEQVDAVKELTGKQMNRMDNAEQAAYEKRKREAGKKTEYRLENSEGNLFEVTKAEHDYAKWLEAAQKPETKPAPVTSEAAALRAKIVPDAIVEVSLVRGAKLTHRAKVRDVDEQSGLVTVTFQKGDKFNGGETQTVRLDQVAPLKGVRTRILNEQQFEGMSPEQKRQVKSDAKAFQELVRDHPELGFYDPRIEDATGKYGDMAVTAARKDAYLAAMKALGGDPMQLHKDNAVMMAELLPKLREAVAEKAQEMAAEMPDSELDADTDFLPKEKAPKPAAPKLRASDGSGTGELLQGDAEPFNLVSETAKDRALRERREEAERAAQEAKEAAEAKAQQDRDQQNLFSYADTAPSKPLSQPEAQAVADRLAALFPGAMKTVVVADASELPRSVTDALDALGVTDRNRAEGVVVDGVAYLNAAALGSKERAPKVWLHELAGHGGTDAVLARFSAKTRAELMERIAKLFPKEHKAVTASGLYAPEKHLGEVLARLMESQKPEHRTLLNKILDWFRVKLASIGLKDWARSDVEALLRRGMDRIRKPSQTVAEPRSPVSELSGNELVEEADRLGIKLEPAQEMYVINRDVEASEYLRGQVSAARARLSASRITPQQDADYMDAVKRGDTETAQRMVDEAAKKAGYDVADVWHGTRASKPITEFRIKEGSEEAAFFSDSKDEALQFPYPIGSTSAVRVVLRGDLLEVNAKRELYTPEEMERWLQEARAEGKEGVHVRNIQNFENGQISDTYAVFSPSQIKSADPITRDASGRVIPLSERFNPDSNDIRFSIAREPGTEPSEPVKRKQFFGRADEEAGGREYTPQKWRSTLATVKSNFFNGSVPVTPETTEKAWDLWEDWTSRERSAEISNRLMNETGGGLGEGALLGELRKYAVKLAGEGDPLLWNSLRMDSSEIVTTMSNTDRARSLTGRALAMDPLSAAMKAEKESLETVLKDVGGDMTLINELQEKIKALETKIADMEAAAKTVPGIDGATDLQDWFDTKADAPAATKRRKQRAATKGGEDAADEEGWQDRTAKQITDKFQTAQTEWLKPDAKVNEVRELAKAALKDRDGDSTERLQYLKDLAADFESLGVSPVPARDLAAEIWGERQNRASVRVVREMERVTGGKVSLKFLRDVIAGAPRSQRNDPVWRKETELNFLLDAGLPEEYARAAQKMFDAALLQTWAKAQEQVARQLLGSHPAWAAKKQSNPVKATTDMQRIFRALRAGIMDPSVDWMQRLGKENGWNGISPKDHARLQDLDDLIHDEQTDRHQKAKAYMEINTILKKASLPEHWLHTVSDAYIASALSGTPTFAVNTFSPVFANLKSLFVQIVSNPSGAKQATMAFGRAMSNMVSEIKFAAKNDAFVAKQNEHLRQSGRLKEMMMAGVETLRDPKASAMQRTKALGKVIYGSMSLVGRTLSSLDEAAKAATREFSLFIYATKAMQRHGMGKDQIDAVVDSIYEVKRQAYEDAVAAGMKPLDARVRSNDVALEAYHDAIESKVGKDEASEVSAAARMDSESTVGALHEGIKESDEGMISRPFEWILEAASKTSSEGSAISKIGVKMMLGFVNVPFRTMKYFAGFGPYGLIRSAVHSWRTNRGLETLWKQSYGTRLQARQRLTEALVGTGLMAALAAFSKSTADDDGKDGIFVTGSGPLSNDPGVRDAWLKKWVPFSVNARIGGVTTTLPLGRAGESFLAAASLAAAFDDFAIRHKHEAGKMHPRELGETAEIAGSYFYSFGQRGIFNSFGKLGDIANARQGQQIEKIAGVAGYTLSGLFPWNSLIQSTNRALSDPKDRSSMQTAFWLSTPVGLFIGKPAVNVLGDEIGDRSAAARMLREGAPVVVAAKDSDSPAYHLILKYNQSPSALNRKITEASLGMKLSDDQWYRFQVLYGQSLKTFINGRASSLERLKAAYDPERKRTVSAAEQFNDWMTKYSKMAKDKATYDLKRRTGSRK